MIRFIYNRDIVDSASHELDQFKEQLRTLLIKNRHLLKHEQHTHNGVTYNENECRQNGCSRFYGLTKNDNGDWNDPVNSPSFSHCLAMRYFLSVDLNRVSYSSLCGTLMPIINNDVVTLGNLLGKSYGSLINLRKSEVKHAIYEWNRFRLNLNNHLISLYIGNTLESVPEEVAASLPAKRRIWNLVRSELSRISARVKAAVKENTISSTSTSSHSMSMYSTSSGSTSLSTSMFDDPYCESDCATDELKHEFENDNERENLIFYMIAKWANDDSWLKFAHYFHYGIPRARLRRVAPTQPQPPPPPQQQQQQLERMNTWQQHQAYYNAVDQHPEFQALTDQMQLQLMSENILRYAYEYALCHPTAAARLQQQQQLGRRHTSASRLTCINENGQWIGAKGSSFSQNEAGYDYDGYYASPENSHLVFHSSGTSSSSNLNYHAPSGDAAAAGAASQQHMSNHSSGGNISQPLRMHGYTIYKRNSKTSLASKSSLKSAASKQQSPLKRRSSGSSSHSLNQSNCSAQVDMNNNNNQQNISSSNLLNKSNGSMSKKQSEKELMQKLEQERAQKRINIVNSRSDLSLVEGGILTNNNIYFPVSDKKHKHY